METHQTTVAAPLSPDPSWWRDRKVFVSGHTGFKGAWLCMLLQKLGAQVHGYSLPPPTNPSLFELAGLSKSIHTTLGDVRDLENLTQALKESDAQVVIHMAAQSLVRSSYQDPHSTYAVNVMGTVNMLEAVRNGGESVQALLVITTDKCYENREWIWPYRENEPLGGRDPYSSSKACAELVTSAYRDSFFQNTRTAVASARAGNVIGGGDWAKDRLIPDIITAFSQSKAPIIRNPASLRPWQFVLEPLAGYLQLAEKLVEKGSDFAEAWNFGPWEQDAQPVRWIADQLAGQWGGTGGANARWELSQAREPHESKTLKLDAAKAHTRLRWRPRTDLAMTLQWIVQWYKAWQSGEDVHQLCNRQIEAFLKLSVAR